MRKIVVALLLASVAACNGDSTAPGTGTLAGDYLMQTANAKPVPTIAIQDQSGKYEVLHGRVVLRDNLSFVDSLFVRFTPPGGTAQSSTDVREGTYVQNGDNVTLTFQTSTGSYNTYYVTWINGNTLVYAEEELSFIYRK